MRVTIAGVGRLKDGAERVLVDRYVERAALGKALGIGPVREVEIAESRLAGAPERRVDETARLLKGVGDVQTLVVLDAKGRHFTSEQFAQWLATQRDGGTRHAAVVIGGPDGHDPALIGKATLTLALGTMILPHGLARAVISEQLYRAITILAGHPYHRA
jgi:23S rRNA (pseudouridine1915-N3)-methyltransferase